MVAGNESSGFDNFADCLSTTVIARLAPDTSKRKRAVKGRKNEIKPVASIPQPDGGELGDAGELSEFVQVYDY